MNNPFETYEQIIQTWQDHDYTKLESIPVDKSLLPLKLFLLSRDTEAQELLTDAEDQSLRSIDKAFLLEAKLVSFPFDSSTTQEVELANEIIALFDRAYFANITLANNYENKKEFLPAIPAYQKAITIAPNSDKVVADLIYTCIMAEQPNEAHPYDGLIKPRYERIIAVSGLLGLSSAYRKVALAAIFAVISLFYPYSLILFIPMLAFFSKGYLDGRKTENRLIKFISIQYAAYLAGFTLLSLFIHFVL